MKKNVLLAVVLAMFAWAGMQSQGIEDFANSNAPTSYADDSFVGNGAVTWTYVASRDANGDGNSAGITLPALMLRRASSDSKVTSSSISGGIGELSVKLYKGFTGAGDRQVELFVNGVSQGLSTAFDDNSEHLFEVKDINISGEVIIEIVNTTEKQVIIDDITWTGSGVSIPKPMLTDVLPVSGLEVEIDESFNVSATVTTEDAAGIDSVCLAYGSTDSTLNDTVKMVAVVDTFSIPMSIDNAGTKYGQIVAFGANGKNNTSSIIEVNVVAPQMVALPYSEDFTSGLGQVYAYSVSGAKAWYHYSDDSLAQMNGYGSSEIEEDWLILPAVDLDNQSGEVLTFDAIHKYGADEDATHYFKLYYSADYAGIGDPTSATWAELSFTQPSEADSLMPSGDVDLSGISGTSVYIAFKHYYADNYRRWGVDNVKIEVAPTSINEQVEFSFVVYPNPAVSSIQLTKAVERLEFVNLSGRTLMAVDNVEANTLLDISSLATGVYFVKVSADGKTGVSKLIKQ